MRWLSAILGLTFLWLQGSLWLADDGYRKTREIRHAVRAIQAENRQLQSRNDALGAEVHNLKTSFEAAEERARSDLGMIGPRETFYQIIPMHESEKAGS